MGKIEREEGRVREEGRAREVNAQRVGEETCFV